MTGRMRISPAGIELIKSFEGFREIAVRLPDGRWTIGYGHVRTAREGLTITPKDAEALLKHDLLPVEQALASLVYAPLMQEQFDALASLAFNISVGQFRESEILAQLNAGNYLAAANGFDLWRKARLHGRVMIVDALVRRRAAEKALFLDHPSGHPSAPTPIVTPQIDTDAPPRTKGTAEAVNDDDAQEGEGPRASGEIAEAVRRLAERTQGAILPPAEIALPPGAMLVPPPPPAAPAAEEPPVAELQVEPDVEQAEPETEPTPEPAAEPQPQPEVTAERIDRASRTMAERVARILSAAEQKIEKHEAVPAEEPNAAPKPVVANIVQPDVREGLPDFDMPSERIAPAAANRLRNLIDDMEVVEPGKDPASLFAEAERKAKLVNGHSRRVGVISGRLLAQMPWIVVLVLSLLGFVIGAVDTFKDGGAETGGPRFAGTILAVFGVMTLMSLYYLFWKRTSDES